MQYPESDTHSSSSSLSVRASVANINRTGQGSNQLNQTITDMQSQLGSGIVKALMNTYYALNDGFRPDSLGFFSATIAAIVAYGAVAAAVTGIHRAGVHSVSAG